MSFICLLRIAAAARILWPSVVLPGDIRFRDMADECFIKVGRDKRHSAAMLVDVPCPLAQELLRYLVAEKRPKDLRLFQACSSTLRRKMRILVADLGWTHLRLVPHSLRYGGVVHDHYVRGLSVEAVQVRGRWHARKYCHAYLADGLATLASQQFPRNSSGKLRRIMAQKQDLRKKVRRLRRQLRTMRGRSTGSRG